MTYVIAFLSVLVLIVFLLPFVVTRKVKNKIRMRDDCYHEWNSHFNDIVMVESILSIICSDFLLSQNCVWKLSPDDMINHLYKGLCFNLGGDAMELESIALNIEKKFNVNVSALLIKETSLFMLVEYVFLKNKVP